MSENERIIGIDLGTSNSAACVFIDGKPTIVPSAEGATVYGKAFPSYVAFTDDGDLLVGEPAKKQAVTNPENTIKAIKRKMGSDYTVDIQGKGHQEYQNQCCKNEKHGHCWRPVHPIRRKRNGSV